MSPRIVLCAAVLLVPLVQAAGQNRRAPDSQTRSPHGPLAIPCENCHTQTSWKPIRAIPEFNHNTTSYPLRGMHEKVDCTQCHVKPVFSNVSTQCSDCHADIHRGQFGANCEQCHTVLGWNVSVQAIRNHENRFPLIGAHAAVECVACHTSAASGQFQGLSTECYSCHARDFQTTTQPNHVTAAFSTNCQACHSVNTWLDAKFDHSATGFPLTGAHVSTACASCHVGNNYNLTAANTVCSACHISDFQKTTNPNHVQSGIATACASCHSTTAWMPASFDHNATGFPLTGTHVSTPCASCHVNNNYNITNTACVSCHQTDYNNASTPVNHVQLNFPTNCQSCHDTVAWTNAKFDHSTTGFPLTGAHVSTPCASCHVNNNYSLTGANTTCISCHLNDYKTATSPVNHVAAAFPTTCNTCHDTVIWTNGAFNHSTTGWALTGAHVAAACTSCHVNNNYSLTSASISCSACHIAAFQSTTNPPHVAAGFPTDCTVCHSTSSWAGATFNHTMTGFALTGAHVNVACTSCHVSNNYSLTSTACVTCHQSDYNNAITPINHIQLGFPTTCEVCHNTVAWSQGAFNHNNTPFPLTGAHTSVPCASCHVNNNYTSLPTACYGCHQTDYQGTNNPNHVAAGFPTTCQTCHNTTAWTGATFNHTWFPTNHGNAQGVCSTCHTNSSNYAVFQCTGCHGNNNAANFHHPNVGGYVYNSINCYSCHP